MNRARCRDWHFSDMANAMTNVRFEGGLCCKSRKLQSRGFFAKTRSGRQSLIRRPSIALGDPSVAV
jgi:hypothetical protein